jgi:hypothetical protein
MELPKVKAELAAEEAKEEVEDVDWEEIAARFNMLRGIPEPEEESEEDLYVDMSGANWTSHDLTAVCPPSPCPLEPQSPVIQDSSQAGSAEPEDVGLSGRRGSNSEKKKQQQLPPPQQSPQTTGLRWEVTSKGVKLVPATKRPAPMRPQSPSNKSSETSNLADTLSVPSLMPTTTPAKSVDVPKPSSKKLSDAASGPEPTITRLGRTPSVRSGTGKTVTAPVIVPTAEPKVMSTQTSSTCEVQTQVGSSGCDVQYVYDLREKLACYIATKTVGVKRDQQLIRSLPGLILRFLKENGMKEQQPHVMEMLLAQAAQSLKIGEGERALIALFQDPDVRADVDVYNGVMNGQTHFANKKMMRDYCQRRMDDSFLGLDHLVNLWPPWRKHGCVEKRLRKEYVQGKAPKGFVRTQTPLELSPGNAKSLSARV